MWNINIKTQYEKFLKYFVLVKAMFLRRNWFPSTIMISKLENLMIFSIALKVYWASEEPYFMGN